MRAPGAPAGLERRRDDSGRGRRGARPAAAVGAVRRRDRVAYLRAALGHRNVITFDMGGTSTDVGLIVAATLAPRNRRSAKYHLLLPMVDVRAIGAGGGSIARVEEGGYLRVGPRSAGADPGPACYGRGGSSRRSPMPISCSGILDPDYFLGGQIALDPRRRPSGRSRRMSPSRSQSTSRRRRRASSASSTRGWPTSCEP